MLEERLEAQAGGPVGRWRVVGPFFGSEWHHQLQHTVRLKDRYGEVQDPRAHVTAFDRKK